MRRNAQRSLRAMVSTKSRARGIREAFGAGNGVQAGGVAGQCGTPVMIFAPWWWPRAPYWPGAGQDGRDAESAQGGAPVVFCSVGAVATISGLRRSSVGDVRGGRTAPTGWSRLADDDALSRQGTSARSWYAELIRTKACSS